MFWHFLDASGTYKGGWSHATSPAPGQGIFKYSSKIYLSLQYFGNMCQFREPE